MEMLHNLFEQQADTHPQNIVLICQDAVLTYQDLEQRANRWAHLLRAKGAKSKDIIGLMLPRSVDLYAAMLAILKIGATYLPYDPEFPEERIQYILQDCKAKFLITNSNLKNKAANSKPFYKILCADTLEEKLSQQASHRIDKKTSKISDDLLCYIIYTSGSTGRPKGVEISHQNILNYLAGAKTIYNVTHKDRIYQGFSIAFDASLEEIWLAFATGATLVVGASNTLHAGASLSEFLNLHKVTVLSTIPTLLSMLDGEIPSLRLLILGGEVCNSELVKRWSRQDLKIFNTYGPTETTVVATYCECSPKKNITIGKPLPNYELFIFDEKLNPVKSGEIGELYIGGKGVALGYVNLPQLTKQKFISHPSYPEKRLYKTGDLCCQTSDGEYQFMGRIDEQIKLRGYRIELSEIEAVIEQQDSAIKKAVVGLQELTKGVQSLVGYLILKDDAQFAEENLTKELAVKLPEYMIPTLFEVIKELPLLPNGKINRKALPIPKMHNDFVTKHFVAAKTDLEKKIVKVWEDLFKHQPISITANFFNDLGGHSLLAAKAVSLLRKFPEMAYISMLDLYENPTVKLLAEKVENFRHSNNNTNYFESEINNPNNNIKWLHTVCGFAQSVGIYIRFALSSWQFLLFFLTLTFVIDKYTLFSAEFFITMGILLIGIHPALFGIAILSKWLLLGRIKEGSYPLWGWFYIRWWLVQQIFKLTPIKYISDSPLMNLFCQLNGMKLGRNCHIGTDMIGAFDLISIGDNSTISEGAMVFGYAIEQGWMKFGPINIGKRCYVGVKSVLDVNTTMRDDAILEDLSMLPANITIPAKKTYSGSPAKRKNKKAFKDFPIDNPPLSRNILFGILHYFALVIVLGVYTIALIPGTALLNYFFYYKNNLFQALLTVPIGAILAVLIICASIVLLKKLLLKTIKPGTYSTQSIYYLRIWFIERFFLEGNVIEALYGSLYLPMIFRLLGAKVGKRAEISTGLHCSPDLVTIEDECFIADLALIGSPKIYCGHVTFAPITIGKRTFIGNSALLPPNTKLGEKCLVGCLSVPPKNKRAKANTSWFGSPALFLPKREILAGFSDKQTYIPPTSLYIVRGLIDFLRGVTPSVFAFFGLALQFAVIGWMLDRYTLFEILLLFPFFDILIAIGLSGIAIGLKWILMRRYHEAVKPAWSLFVWLNEYVTCLFEFVIVPMLFEPLLGTPFCGYILKALGTKVGHRVLFDTAYFTEFDLVDIGDDVYLNMRCTLQTHLFEDRIMKMGKIKIGNGCSVGDGAIVLYNTIMEENSSLGSLSLLMKGEILPHNSHWEGIPAQHVSQYAVSFSPESSIDSIEPPEIAA